MTAASLRGWRVLAAAVVLATAAAVAAPAPATAGEPQPSTPTAAERRPAVDQSLRMDRQAKVFTATGYQTLAVVGLAGGAAVVGAMAGGASTAIVAGTAVVLIYLFLP